MLLKGFEEERFALWRVSRQVAADARENDGHR